MSTIIDIRYFVVVGTNPARMRAREWMWPRQMPNVGTKLKELRRRRSLSIRDIATRSGVSHSTISLIERDRISPSIDTLVAVLDALGSTLVGFFRDLGSTSPYSPFYASSDFMEIGNPSVLSHRVIGVNFPNRQLLMLCETYAAGADSGQPFSHPAQEAGLVTRGAVELTVGPDTKVLNAGDGYYFDSQLPHRFRNVFPGESEIVSAVSPPTY